MKIDIIARDGSPLFVTEKSIYGEDGRVGVGGAELAILTLCRGWQERGHDVTFYNNPSMQGGSSFRQLNISDFAPQEDRDILIIFRSPNPLSYKAKGKKIWFSCDQFTIDDFKAFAKTVDKIVGISEFHRNYFHNIYGIDNMEVIGCPIRTWEYPKTEKKKNSCIFTSVPDRGLLQLAPIWDKIVAQVPDATLTITGDWSLWNGADVSQYLRPYKMAWAGKKNVTYRSAVCRNELLKIQLEAEYHLYPCVYDELFCIAVAESQVAGAVPITSSTGALQTTNRFGHKIEGNPSNGDFISNFVDTTVRLMLDENKPDIRTASFDSFGIDKILDDWEKVFNG